MISLHESVKKVGYLGLRYTLNPPCGPDHPNPRAKDSARSYSVKVYTVVKAISYKSFSLYIYTHYIYIYICNY